MGFFAWNFSFLLRNADQDSHGSIIHFAYIVKFWLYINNMSKEIRKKLTSFTLMAIMVAGGLTFAAPGLEPASAQTSNANLFVSAQIAASGNTITAPQVVEIVISDSDINDTDEGTGAPDVTVNGSSLTMVQATDGNWYAYIASKEHAINANAMDDDGNSMTGINFGTIPPGAMLDDVDGDAWPLGSGDTKVYQLSSGTERSSDFNVVREAKQPNTNNQDHLSHITSGPNVWPFVHLYDFADNVTIQYNKGGDVQTASFDFDTVGGSAELDRDTYPQGSQIHITITDAWLNIDPTDEDTWTFDTDAGKTFYLKYDESGMPTDNTGEVTDYIGDLNCDENCLMLIDRNGLIEFQDNENAMGTFTDQSDYTVTVAESEPNTGIFVSYDDNDDSSIIIADNVRRNTTAIFDYQDSSVSVRVGHEFATINITPNDDAWNSGEAISVEIVDPDANKNSRSDEDLVVSDSDVKIIPAFETGDPFTIAEGYAPGEKPKVLFVENLNSDLNTDTPYHQVLHRDLVSTIQTTVSVDKFSDRAIVSPSSDTSVSVSAVDGIIIDFNTTELDFEGTFLSPGNVDLDALDAELDTYLTFSDEVTAESIQTIKDNARDKDHQSTSFKGFNLYNQDISVFGDGTYDVWLLHIHDDSVISIVDNDQILGEQVYADLILEDVGASDFKQVENHVAHMIDNLGDHKDTDDVGLALVKTDGTFNVEHGNSYPIVTDFFSYGFLNSGDNGGDRVANQIIRIQAEETDDNTSTFAGSLEYIMINQLNILDPSTYTDLSVIDDEPTFIVMEDYTDEDSIRVNYLDLGSDGVETQISDQQEAPTTSGIVSLDAETYKVADTVTITLEDADLNIDSGLIEVYTIPSGENYVGEKLDFELNTGNLGRVLDVTFDDSTWIAGCDIGGLAATGFTLAETDTDSGVFTGNFQIPDRVFTGNEDSDCALDDNGEVADSRPASGLDIEVNYVDFRDASGEIIEVGDGAGVRANTGSATFDRTVYPVPIGPSDFTGDDYLEMKDLSIHVRINDADYDLSASGEDTIAESGVGPVKISVLRGSDEFVVGFAGGNVDPNTVYVTDNDGNVVNDSNGEPLRMYPNAQQFGTIEEIAPDAGIFEADIPISYTDGPDNNCPSDFNDQSGNGCILQGDILQVEYTDPTDASGSENTVTDSATFDLRNGVLQSDKSVYIIGSDIILTLIEPDFDLDNDQAETYPLNLIEWDSDAATVAMGEDSAFDPEPSDLRETGDSTGIFQIVVEMPGALDGDRLERGEEIELEYVDRGPSGSDFVGDETEDINLTIYTSNFGATVELDQKVYTWTDKVYITIVAPDHNEDSNLIDEIGNTELDPIKVSTRSENIDMYKLVETGTDTGIFTGEVILTGFNYDADGDTTTGDDGRDVLDMPPSEEGSGPTDGKLPAKDDDGFSVSFEYSEDETVVSSAIIRWNVGEAQWLEASYPATGTGIVRVIDPDMNWKPEAVDNFTVDVWSESDAGGINLTVTETNEATGIFEGTVFFDVTGDSTGHRLRVAEGDTITAEYSDNTLPAPDSAGDSMAITATTLIGTIVPPLERAPASNLRVVDSNNNSLDTVSVDRQVQIMADLTNGQDKDQPYAYLVQVQDENGVTVKLDWTSGTLAPAQSFSTASSWTPTSTGSYTATVFVWESLENPTALSPPLTTTITVN